MDSFGSRISPRFVPGRIREGDVVRPKSNRFSEGNGRFQGKEKSCFVVVQFELIFRHPCFYVVCASFGEVGHITERSAFLELCHLRR